MKGSNLDACVQEETLLKNSADLRVLTTAITSMAELVHPETPSSWVELDISEGTGMMKNLDVRQEAHVINSFYFAGTKFPTHTHPGLEIIIVYRGLLELNLIEERQTVLVGEGHKPVYWWDATTPHAGYFPKDTALYGITMPPDANWPR